MNLYLMCCLMAVRSKPRLASVATKTSPHLLSPPSSLSASAHKHLCSDDCSPMVPCYLLIYSLFQGDFSQRDLCNMEDLSCGPHESDRKLLESLEQKKMPSLCVGLPGSGYLLGLTSHLSPLHLLHSSWTGLLTFLKLSKNILSQDPWIFASFFLSIAHP